MNIEFINKESETAVAIKREAVRFDGDIGAVMGEAYEKLGTYLAQQGKQMTGVPYCKYWNGSEDYMQFDLEMGLPVSEPLAPKDDIYMTKTCEGRAICATHKGSYKDIEKTYTPMMEYLAKNNLESTGVYYDYYLNDPDNTAESELLTKVIFPIK